MAVLVFQNLHSIDELLWAFKRRHDFLVFLSEERFVVLDGLLLRPLAAISPDELSALRPFFSTPGGGHGVCISYNKQINLYRIHLLRKVSAEQSEGPPPSRPTSVLQLAFAAS